MDVPKMRPDGVRAADERTLHGARWACDCTDLDRTELSETRHADELLDERTGREA